MCLYRATLLNIMNFSISGRLWIFPFVCLKVPIFHDNTHFSFRVLNLVRFDRLSRLPVNDLHHVRSSSVVESFGCMREGVGGGRAVLFIWKLIGGGSSP